MTRAVVSVTLLLLLLLGSCCQAAILLAPPSESINALPAVSLVMIQGASIDATAYIALAKAIQNESASTSAYSVWVAMPEYALDLALPIGPLFENPLLDAINQLTQQQQRAGVQGAVPAFFWGHSLGAASIQDYVFDHPKVVANGGGIILSGAVPLRKHNNGTFPAPILSLVGELDGMQRTSRVAEAVYHHVLFPKSEDGSFVTAPSVSTPSSTTLLSSALSATDVNERIAWAVDVSPIVVMPGLCHMSCCDAHAQANPPLAVRMLDFHAAADAATGHVALARAIVPFMAVALSRQGSPAAATHADKNVDEKKKALMQQMQDTVDYVMPLVAALELEGSWHLKPACNSDHPVPHCPFYPAWPLQSDQERSPATEDSDCWCGSTWSEKVSMPAMAGLANTPFPVLNADAFHDVTNTKPYHHAHLWSNCSNTVHADGACVVNTTTVTQLIYEYFDDYDTGFTTTAATEMRTKMVSRQQVARASVNVDAQLEVTDATSICATINKQAYLYALEHAHQRALDRFTKVGMKMTFGEDVLPPIPIGPLWIYNALKYEQVKDDISKETVMRVSAPAMKTPLEGIIIHLYPDSAGYHYCKVLSPAKTMEWLYTDSLHAQLGF